MRIPEFLNRDDYLQNPILRRFLKDHRISFVENRADYIREIEAYSERDERSAAEVRDWLLHVIKEGSKEICYKKVRSINEWHRDPVLLEAKIQELYPDCPRETILTYTNTAECKLIDYTLITNEENMITKIELTFSKLFLYGESGKLGNATVFPVFIEVYLDSGFIVSRAKAKSTLYEYSDTNEFLTIVHAPKILLLDEPSTGLDIFTVLEIQKMIKNYKKQAGTSILISSHNMDELENLCDDIMIINKGEKVFLGSKEDLLKEHRTHRIADAFEITVAKEVSTCNDAL